MNLPSAPLGEMTWTVAVAASGVIRPAIRQTATGASIAGRIRCNMILSPHANIAMFVMGRTECDSERHQTGFLSSLAGSC
jgi:hypothetical protein